MVYMDADSYLENEGIDDFIEMASVDSASNLNIVVQFDRYGGLYGAEDDIRYGNWTDAKRFVVTNGMTPTADNATQDLEEVDMGDWGTLVDFVNWTVANYPANHYALDLWDHGGDWYGLCWDYTSGTVMQLGDLASALWTLSSYHPTLVYDIIAFDACSMGSIEVAYELAGYADYMLGSEVYVPDDGLNYTSLQAIVDTPNISTLDLCARFMTDYASYYYSLVGTPKEFMLNESFSLSTVDLDKIDPLVLAIDALATEMISNIDAWWDQIYMARNLTEDYAGWRQHDVVDIYHMSERLGEALWFSSTAQGLITDVMDAFNNSVVSEIHGTNPANCTLPVDHVHGLTVNYPGADAYFDEMYLSVGNWFQSSTQWDEFLVIAYIGRPYVAAWEPTGDSVLTDTVIVAWLSEPIILMPNALRLYQTGQSGVWVEGDLSYFEPGHRLEFVPKVALLPGVNYTVQCDIYDLQGNHVGFYWQFTTAAEIPEFPSLVQPLLIVLAIVFFARAIGARTKT